ncbi:ATP-dependent RNA helicase-like protein DB10 isoform X1 [Camellia sinensis]|uniref:ATP-dependent RNA helicase-like protein DB10 isoform X1 n=1 Tax=Camellia sinensis TaxID=4442 RepID=UPI0010366A31|nr:ATP-dependent RNA helicase-like protein DB10 isoform X1 [Camellia sinensis]XP_028118416.1 ATP-dependent RNA helicase-like protein DB10 isoform X1 [Camellia sinensis]XP_028118417.1 ATP-dependent RNA helicase-like protein DB10 isoform X1 [Camellia sinensis]XP_028118418.1 ATP-dependent RNA helicase-like protein DB10 isoform X1 [Camellia sinensis]
MMATATVSFASPRYSPEDPTLPKPWKGLVDGKTGYLYFWNPETNVTQYEKPAASSHTGSAPPQKLSAAPVSSSVQVEQSSHGHCDSIFNDDDDRYNGGSNSGSKLDTGTRSYQGDNVPPPLTSFEATGFPSELLRESGKGGSDHSQNVPNEEIGVGHGGSSGRGYGFWLLEMAHLLNLIAVSMKLLLVEIMYPLL